METAIWVTTMRRWTEKRSRLPAIPRSPDLSAADGIGTGAAHGGDGAEDDAGERGHDRGEEQHSPVGDDGEMDGVLAGVERRDEQPAEGLRQRDAERCSAEREQAAFDEQLPQHAAARCAEGHADGHLTLPRAGAGEHQVGEVGAGDEQHQPGDGEQQLQR